MTGFFENLNIFVNQIIVDNLFSIELNGNFGIVVAMARLGYFIENIANFEVNNNLLLVTEL